MVKKSRKSPANKLKLIKIFIRLLPNIGNVTAACGIYM